jgi:hypothetical protein
MIFDLIEKRFLRFDVAEWSMLLSGSALVGFLIFLIGSDVISR